MYEDYYYDLEDKDAYLRRLEMDPADFVPDKKHLDELLLKHHQHVPFDNLDVWDRAVLPDLGIPALFDKIVNNKRGGYCFEMNGLLEAALRTLGYSCFSVEVKIIRGRDFLPPARHRAVIVTIDGKKHFCDVGLGFIFFPQSSVFNEGYNDYGIKAVCEDGICRIYERAENGEDKVLLWFKDAPADPVDFVNPNFCCSQDPASGFRTRLSMVIMTPEGYRENLVCSQPSPKNGERYSPQFTITIKDGPRLLSEKNYCGASELEEKLLNDFGVRYSFG